MAILLNILCYVGKFGVGKKYVTVAPSFWPKYNKNSNIVNFNISA